MHLATSDLIVFAGYILAMMGFGIWLANKDKAETSQDYFLASKALPWWAVGGSLIASNISTEQIMGMNGSGFEIGMAIASYELMAAITLIIVAKFFLPIFIKEGISTMPQFLERRYSQSVRSIMSVFWVALFVFVNITSVLYLGGLAIESLLGIPLVFGIIGLVIYSASFSIFGGLKAVVWTDVVQVVVLALGGTLASYFVVSAVGDGSFFSGVATLFEKTPERFNMIFSPTDTYVERLTGETKSSYALLPGFAVLFGGMWIANLYYWGNNQYIIQRALAAKTLGEAQRGVAFAAFLKIFMPIIVVLPGIAAFILNADISKADEAFPWVLNNYVGVGFKGLTFAALVAAIGSSISSMVNSASTIFTLDIYKPLINKGANESQLVFIGKIAAGAALIIGALLGPLLGNLGQVVQFIQEYTGFISPGVVVVFIFGMFWKRATPNAALAVVLASIPLSIAFKALYPDLPFVDRIAITFLICVILLIGISLYESKTQKEVVTDGSFRWGVIASIVCIGMATGIRILLEDIPNVGNNTAYLVIVLSLIGIGLVLGEKRGDNAKSLDIDKSLFKTDTVFNLSAVLIVLILTAIYTTLG
ncbi:MAG: sodium/solute symporter [Saprospiraceae bacterium]